VYGITYRREERFMSTWLITGCSTGLGPHLAQEVQQGHRAVVTARNASTVTDLVEKYRSTGLALPLDVTDSARVNEPFGGPRSRRSRC
jgi:NADP-dependent 3-hydroxy acid dehydrogenase YdfG